MQRDDEVKPTLAQLPDGPPRAPAVRRAVLVIDQHFIDGGMVGKDPGTLRTHHHRDMCVRKMLANRRKHRRAQNDVAEKAGLDDEDPHSA